MRNNKTATKRNKEVTNLIDQTEAVLIMKKGTINNYIRTT